MNFLDKYRVQIGLALVILILIGGVVLLWKEELFGQKRTKQVSSQVAQTSDLQNEIESLKKEIARLNETLSKTEIESQVVTQEGKIAGQTTQNGSNQNVSGLVNINTADQKTLESLSGIGPVYASRIIDYRNAHGGFKNIEEIQNVKGIGPKTFEKIKDKITVG